MIPTMTFIDLLLANLLAFYLANLLAFDLAFYLAYLQAFYLAYLLALYLAYLLAPHPPPAPLMPKVCLHIPLLRPYQSYQQMFSWPLV